MKRRTKPIPWMLQLGGRKWREFEVNAGGFRRDFSANGGISGGAVGTNVTGGLRGASLLLTVFRFGGQKLVAMSKWPFGLVFFF